VRFLVDAQLPPLLSRHLRELGHEAEHVADIGLSAASDRDILITKDEDFVTMRALRADGPAVVWVRIGNTTRRALLTRFSAVQAAIFSALERGETVVEVSGQFE
jgi:predicted nuclease of predicted toxin-antitoxin system